MTPLIDVSLVLVVMLLIATPLAFESSIAVRKARTSAKAAEKKKVEERIELYVVSEDSVKVNRQLVARSELTRTLQPLLATNASRIVVINCSDGVSHGSFVDVLDQAKISGAAEIAVIGK
ncbi:MAG: hypothetical protein GTO29_08430 [Candidatus Latescibacteria bacterium]|nr:hypothetical protein [Candidatus Latescibacterota bacterium]NIO56189.1 hypothetical protein [Candidatus Latescibacterota bacterium]